MDTRQQTDNGNVSPRRSVGGLSRSADRARDRSEDRRPGQAVNRRPNASLPPIGLNLRARKKVCCPLLPDGPINVRFVRVGRGRPFLCWGPLNTDAAPLPTTRSPPNPGWAAKAPAQSPFCYAWHSNWNLIAGKLLHFKGKSLAKWGTLIGNNVDMEMFLSGFFSTLL